MQYTYCVVHQFQHGQYSPNSPTAASLFTDDCFFLTTTSSLFSTAFLMENCKQTVKMAKILSRINQKHTKMPVAD